MELQVIKDSDGAMIGRIKAEIGMILSDSTQVTKVNEKSIFVSSEWSSPTRVTDTRSIYYTQAAKWGFATSDFDINEEEEKIAALTRLFSYGEFLYELHGDRISRGASHFGENTHIVSRPFR